MQPQLERKYEKIETAEMGYLKRDRTGRKIIAQNQIHFAHPNPYSKIKKLKKKKEKKRKRQRLGSKTWGYLSRQI